MFINPELIQWSSLVSVYEKILKHGTDTIAATDVFNPNTEEGQARGKELKNRVVEHVSIPFSASRTFNRIFLTKYICFRIFVSWQNIIQE